MLSYAWIIRRNELQNHLQSKQKKLLTDDPTSYIHLHFKYFFGPNLVPVDNRKYLVYYDEGGL